MLQTSRVPDHSDMVTPLDQALQEMADEADLVVLSEYMPGERPTRVVLPANVLPPPQTRAPRSVFDLADFDGYGWLTHGGLRRPAINWPMTIQERIHTVISRDFGVVRCRRLHHTDTTEWQEREAARRARQRPPKPGAKYKTMSEKLKETI